MKNGIMLFNLGGPQTLADVKPFLYKIFSDPNILVGIPSPFRQIIAYFISKIKGPSSVKMYDLIGGSSPQYHWTFSQAKGLENSLSKDLYRVTIGMRASRPTIEEALTELRGWGADSLTFLPLFPQYSTTTTGTCFEEAQRLLALWKWNPKVKEIRHYPDFPKYTGLIQKTVLDALKSIPEGQTPHILFSAHSLPMKIVSREKQYLEDVQRTVKAVAQHLPYPWSLAFQSKNGPIAWLKPYTDKALLELGRAGVKHVIVVPISFVSDHVETLYELDQLYAKTAKKAGIETYVRTRMFNDDPEFTEVLKCLLTLGA